MLERARPICCTRSTPLEASNSGLIFENFVKSDVMSRSSVLSCIAEAGGDAKLPEAVNVSEFRTWMKAVPWNVEASDADISFEDICIVGNVGLSWAT